MTHSDQNPACGSNNDPVSRWKQEFKSKVSEMLRPHDADGTSLFRFLRHWMFRWRIHKVDPTDVLLEGTKRGLAYIQEKEQPIYNPPAWLRKTCLNILKDKIKESVKDENLVFRLETLFGNSEIELAPNTRSPLAEAEFLEQLELLQQAIYTLSSDDRQLVHMRFFQGKTYAQIQQYFEKRDGQLINEAALRQRESRALRRLRKTFFELYDKGADATR